MKRIMAVYDAEPCYAERFAEFANEKGMTPFTVVAFGSIGRLKEFAREQPVEMLLVGENVEEEELSGLAVGQIVRLSEKGTKSRQEDNSGSFSQKGREKSAAVYKYQSSDAVLREVMACYNVASPQEQPLSSSEVKSRIIGVYSPIGRCGKTDFCMTFGQLLAKQGKALYLNMEGYSALSLLTGTKYQSSLSDLLYYYRQGEYNQLKLGSALYNWGGLDYVPPAAYAEDLAEIQGEELAGMVKAIARDGIYEVILVDIGNLGRDAGALLEISETIYVPIKDDCVSMAKIEMWKAYLEKSGKGNLLERVCKLRLPMPKGNMQPENYLEQLLWGEMGKYARNLIAKEYGGRKA